MTDTSTHDESETEHALVPESPQYTSDSAATARCVCGYVSRSTRAYNGENVPDKAKRNVVQHVAAKRRQARRS